MAKATKDSTVTMNYEIKLDDGSLVDSSKEGSPLTFQLGQGNMFPAVEKALVGMVQGDRTTVRLSPEDAFGEHSSELVMVVNRANLPDDVEPEVGMQLGTETPDGNLIRLVVTEVDGADITLDGNHPLAGQTLSFEVELVSFE